MINTAETSKLNSSGVKNSRQDDLNEQEKKQKY